MGFIKEPGRRARRGVAPPPPRGAPAAREALLPPAARARSRGSPATRRGCPPRRPSSGSPRSGYADPTAALRHLEALTSGVTRTAGIQRTLLPAMLEWFADAPDPDAGLFGFRRISEALGSTPWYLKTLRDEGQVAERLARLLATSPLRHRPARARARRACGCSASDARRRSTREAAAERDDRRGRPAGRPGRGGPRGPGRSAAASCSGSRSATCSALIDVADVGAGLSPAHRRDARGRRWTVAGRAVARAARARRGADPDGDRGDGPLRRLRAVLRQRRRRDVRARAGARRRPRRTPSAYAQAVANELRRLLALPGTDPALEVDADLRPEGKQGPLVRTLDVLRRLLREVVGGLGGAGAAARRRGGRRRGPAPRGSPS